jgi:phosphatidylcholine synthase
MVEESAFFFSKQQRIAAWLVHLFTASGAVLGLLSLWAIHEQRFIEAFWIMSVALIIDSVDGIMARRARTKVVVPKIDGALLDNMVDYITYVLVPGFFLLAAGLLPAGWWGPLGVSVMVLASAYQFTQDDAKTDDHFFKGFPSYWNIVVFYLFMLESPSWLNLWIILFLSVMVFVPLKYVYPSRMDYLTPNRWLKRLVLVATLIWGVGCVGMMLTYPEVHPIFATATLAYAVFYAAISLYRNIVPVEFSDLEEED